MKRTLYLFVFLLTLSGAAQVSLAQGCDPPAELPPFAFTEITGTQLSPANLVKDAPIIVVYFDPNCDHCQQEAEWIGERLAEFNQINMVWVSWGEIEDIKAFKEKYFPEVDAKYWHFSKDEQYRLDDWFGYSEVPSIFIFNKYWTPTKKFCNEVDAGSLLKYARMAR